MVALIVAHSKNRVIGNKGRIPWSIKGEQRRFKELTVGNVVIMGRRTFEEIGKPLPNRYTIVISSTKKYEDVNCTTVSSLEEALELSKGRDVFISGGVSLYKEALGFVDVMYITEIDMEVEGDTFFPEFNYSEFVRDVEVHQEGNPTFDYVTYTRL